MTVTPVEARCNRCRGDFLLSELLEARDGCCPRCRWRLTDDWAAVLLEEAARVDAAQRSLAGSLRRLRDLPGNMVLLPHPVLRNLTEALGWDRPALGEDVGLDDQRTRLTELAQAWSPRPLNQPRRRSRWRDAWAAFVRRLVSGPPRPPRVRAPRALSPVPATVPVRSGRHRHH